MGTADVRSLDELESLAAALGTFASAAREALDQADSAARYEIGLLEERERDLEWEAAQLNDEYDSLDEDEDGGYLLDHLDEVNGELGNLAAATARLEEAREAFLFGAGELRGIIDDRLPAARGFLERKLEQIRAYLSLSPPTGASSAGQPACPGEAAANDGEALPLDTFRIPAGFTWVPLGQIEATHLAPSDFRKVGEVEMERGFGLLLREVLPRMQGGAPADADLFRELDRSAGRDDGAGARRAFEAFFGLDAIRLERRTGDPVFSITNGRHRVEIARRLGLTHIPARTVEVGG